MQKQENDDVAVAIEREKSSISAIWILPVLALLFGAWMALDRYENRPITITIEFADAKGIIPGKTEVKYEGLTFGRVKDVKVTPSLRGMIATVEVDRLALPILTEQTQFWLVKPEIGVTGITGLDTIISGNYISAMISRDGKESRQFVALESPPNTGKDLPGLHLTILAEDLGSLHQGSPISFKKINIGRILKYKLSEDNGFVEIATLIKPEYAHLVKGNSVFWNRSGIRIHAALSGVDVEVDSIASLIAGGIAMDYQEGPEREFDDNEPFYLFSSYNDANTNLHATFLLPTVEGIEENQTKIRFRGMEVGVITSIQYDGARNLFQAKAELDPDAAPLLVEDSSFWIVKPEMSLTGMSGIDTIISGRYIGSKLGISETKKKEFSVSMTPPAIDYTRPGLVIKLHARQAENVGIGTPIMFRKIAIGEVENVQLVDSGGMIEISARVYPNYSYLISTSSRFWNISAVKMTGSLSGFHLKISSLVNILRGGIELHNGKDGNPVTNAHSFTLFNDRTEALSNQRLGLEIDLITDKANSIRIGSPLYYRHLRVGQIEDMTLADDDEKVRIRCYIEPQYSELINKDSRFWKVSGFRVYGDIYGITLQTESMLSIFNGGISFDSESVGEPITSDDKFELFEDRDDAFKETFMVKLRSREMQGLKVLSPVKFHGIKVGEITKLEFTETYNGVLAHLELDNSIRHLINDGTAFWQVKIEMGMSRMKNLETMVQGQFLTFKPGQGKITDQFEMSRSAPAIDDLATGMNIILLAKDKGSVRDGNPLMYRGVQVGRVTGVSLSTNARDVEIYVNVRDGYQNLIKSGTRFFNMSGVDIDVGLFSGAQVRSTSLESIISGGIGFATPEDATQSDGTDGSRFTLYPRLELEWLTWSPAITVETGMKPVEN